MTYYAVLITTHVNPPGDLDEPHGVFGSRDEALKYLDDHCEQWMARFGGWPFSGNIRINEYSTREEAETADVADGFVRGATRTGHKPISTETK